MKELKSLLDSKVEQYNHPRFIELDPISIPHRFSDPHDIEIAGFLTALISWGNRKAILKSAAHLLELMENEPANFITTASEKEFKRLEKFVYRTFNGDDLLFLVYALRNVYRTKGGLEGIANAHFQKRGEVKDVVVGLRTELLQTEHLSRSEKHLANPLKGSAAKRINMFLRWMVRRDNNGVDFGLWQQLSPAALMCPLDVHSGNTARNLGLLSRKQNDWKAVEELTYNLRKLDKSDPVKYDFALFGMGVFEKWKK